MVILELIHAESTSSPRGRGEHLLDQNQWVVACPLPFPLVTLNNFVLIAWPCAGDISFKCLPYQLSTVDYKPTVVITGDGESGFDSGEGA